MLAAAMRKGLTKASATKITNKFLVPAHADSAVPEYNDWTSFVKVMRL